MIRVRVSWGWEKLEETEGKLRSELRHGRISVFWEIQMRSYNCSGKFIS